MPLRYQSVLSLQGRSNLDNGEGGEGRGVGHTHIYSCSQTRKNNQFKECEDDEGNFGDGPYDAFRLQVFEVFVDNLLTEMKNRYRVVRSLETKFAFLWKYLSMEEKQSSNMQPCLARNTLLMSLRIL